MIIASFIVVFDFSHIRFYCLKRQNNSVLELYQGTMCNLLSRALPFPLFSSAMCPPRS